MELVERTSTRKEYEHTPLLGDHAIRLIQIRPDITQPHGFSLTIQTVTLDDGVPFCTLSYTWKSAKISTKDDDEPTTMVTVQCDGKDLRITENLLHFLCKAYHFNLFTTDGDPQNQDFQTRFPEVDDQSAGMLEALPSFLWIDAIAINQRDMQERSHQVSIMDKIYMSSYRTLVWFGEEDPPPGAVRTLRHFIPEFLSLYRRLGGKFFHGKDPFCHDPTLIHYLGDEVCSQWREDWTSFFLFLVQQRWLLRGWVVQEAILPSLDNPNNVMILCGSVCVPWEELFGFIAALGPTFWRATLTNRLRSHGETKHYGHAYSDLIRGANGISLIQGDVKKCCQGAVPAWFKREYGQTTNTERIHCISFNIIHHLRPQEFTDPRDTVYGCAGLISTILPPGMDNPIVTDYNLSGAEVMTNITWLLLSNMPYLDVLSTVEDPTTTNITGLPSWVPDYSARCRPNPIQATLGIFPGRHMLNVSKTKSHSSYRLVSGNGLGLIGAKVASISTTGPMLGIHTMEQNQYEWFVEHLLSLQEGYLSTDTSQDEALCLTLIADTPLSSVDGKSCSSMFRDWWRNLLAQRIEYLKRDSEGSEQHIINLLQQLGTGREWFPSISEVQEAVEHSESHKEPQKSSIELITRRLWYYRRFFCSDSGHFSVGAWAVREDDEIWILKGGRMPFILRKREESDGYLLVGEAYVHGIMNGEAVTEEFSQQMGPVTVY